MNKIKSIFEENILTLELTSAVWGAIVWGYLEQIDLRPQLPKAWVTFSSAFTMTVTRAGRMDVLRSNVCPALCGGRHGSRCNNVEYGQQIIIF